MNSYSLSMRIRTTFALATLFALSAQALAQSTWTGAVSGQWGDANNWSPVGIPASDVNTQLVFGPVAPGAATDMNLVNVGLPFLLNEITFSAGGPAYTLAGLAPNFRTSSAAVSPQIVFDSDSFDVFNAPVVLTNDMTISGVGSGTLAFNSTISGPGSLTYSGAGTLQLGAAVQSYTGGTFVTSGQLLLGNGTAIPTGGNVTVSGGEFNTNGLGNGDFTSSSNAIGTVALSGTGTFRIPSGAANYHLNQLAMTGGSVDMTGAGAAYLHFRNAGAGITTNASNTTAVMAGGTLTRLQNDSASALPIDVAAGTTPSGIDLDVGIPLSLGNGQAGYREFVKTGDGTMRLTSLNNTADIAVNQGFLRVDDVAALGGGQITLASGGVRYGGPTATSSKNFTIVGDYSGTFQVITPGANLTLSGAINQSPGYNSNVYVSGPFVSGESSAVTFNATNDYNGTTYVRGNATLAIPTITYGNVPTPIGSHSDQGVSLGGDPYRGTLQMIGTDPHYETDRLVEVNGLYGNGSGGAVGVQNAGTSLSLHGQVTGSGSFIKNGPGTVSLTNYNNNYAGGTYIDEGRLLVVADDALGTGAVTVNAHSTLQYDNNPGLQIYRAIHLAGGTLETHDMTIGTAGAVQGEGEVMVANVANIGYVVPEGTDDATLHVSGNYTQYSAGTLLLYADLLAPELPVAKLDVGGDVMLDGTLEMALAGMGQFRGTRSFDVLDWGGTINGAFATPLQLPTFGGAFTWDTSQLYTDGMLTIIGPPEPDFNGDGTVNAADYTVWRNGLGTTYTQNDYEVWKAHFGETAGSGSSSPSEASESLVAVPEPASWPLAVAALLALVEEEIWRSNGRNLVRDKT